LAGLDQQITDLNTKLGGEVSHKSEEKSPSNGYHSNIEPKPDVTKWVQVDLGRAVALEGIRLAPARPTDFADTPGFGFPSRFKVETSEAADFANAQLIADHTAAEYKNPGDAPVVFSLAGATNGSFPLIPALSPKERESRSPPRNEAGRPRSLDTPTQVLPLPKGEGRSE